MWNNLDEHVVSASLAVINTYIHQNDRVTDRERQYKQQTDTYIMQSQ